MGPARVYRLTADGVAGPTGKGLTLYAIVVGKAVAGGTIAVYNGKDTSGTQIATLAMDVATTFDFGNPGAFMDGGIYLDLTGSSPDVTVVAG